MGQKDQNSHNICVDRLKSQIAIAIAILATLLAGIGTGFYFGGLGVSPDFGVTTTTLSQNSILVSNPVPYFPTGYISKLVNFTNVSNGEPVTVGSMNFQLNYP